MSSISSQKASSSSSFSSSTPRWKYDVFLSFRGEDTRTSFTDHLYVALKQRGIVTFRDDENLEIGKSISLELLKAIKESRFVIVILSRNFASSTWCLDEITKIIGCMKEMATTVLPIFYDVDPSDVRKQIGAFAQAFFEHEERFKDDIAKVQTWRTALREVANLKGWHLLDRFEAQLIQDIVGELWKKLNYTFFEDIEDLVGIEPRVKDLESCLAIGSNDVRIIGVLGMGGIGKTTLTRVVFHMVSNKFEACCFLSNVREVCEKDGLIPLQQQLIKKILNESMSIQDVDEGLYVIKNRLCHKRILLVLDDVNQLDQLKNLVGKHTWFGSGSRVIITTRDKHLLRILEVDEICEAEALTDDEALHLLSLKAFKKDHPPEVYLELSKDVVEYTKGLPLAIEIMGSFLFSRSINQWKSTLIRIKEFPERAIHQALKISYDGLHETEKKIFLYIACFFNYEDKGSVVKILDYLGLCPTVGLEVLVDKSLIKMNDLQVWMHDLLQDMGKKIVHEEFPEEPGKRSILWSFEDINSVLTKNTGTETIQGMILKLPESREVYWNQDSFSKMHNLKFLIISNVQLLHKPKHLPISLIFLEWSGYPSKSLPLNFQSNELVELYMCRSYIEQLWKGAKSFEKLKIIQMNGSPNLIETPNLIKVPNLEEMVLEYCLNLREIHPSTLVHNRLTLLNLKGCVNVKTLPSKFEMESLEVLILSGCLKLKKIPEFGENMQRVLELYLDGTSINKLPTSIGHLTSLVLLNVRDCKSLTCLPSSIFNLKLLKDVNISGCLKLERLPENVGNAESVEELDVSGTAIREVPSSTGLLKNLKVLSFGGCKGLSSFNSTSWYDILPFSSRPKIVDPVGLSSLSGLCSLTELNLQDCNLREIPNDIGCLFSLEEIDLSENSFVCLPDSISQLCKLERIYLNNCTSLQSLPKLPVDIVEIWGDGCTSLEMVPDLQKPNSFCKGELYLSNCCKLADNQDFIDIFLAVIRKHHQGLSRHGRYDSRSYNWRYDMIISGSVIPKWFIHQSIGAEVNIKEPSSHLCDEWMGIVVCVVFSSLLIWPSSCSFQFIANGKLMSAFLSIPHLKVGLSDHIWLFYLLCQYYVEEEDKEFLKECEANELSEIGIKIETKNSNIKVKKCGFRMVYKKDIEELNRTMAQSSNTSIVPYEELDVLHHNFDNSAMVAKGKKAKQICDDYDGSGPSGEGSSNDVPHPKRIERLAEFKPHGDSDCEEYFECNEEIMQ